MALYNKDGYSENRDHSTAPNITNPDPRVTPKETTNSKYLTGDKFTECRSHLDTKHVDQNCFKSEIGNRTTRA